MAVTVLLFSLAVTGCGTGGSTPSDSQTEYVIRLGHKPDHSYASVADQYAELLPHHRALLHRHCDRIQKPCAGYDRNAAGGIGAGFCDR